ncbi:hypothetical protein CKAH01_02117 [Colletotrichum kahawae]|uniref:Uncharacterized protein n=1 Tax=Colletotrichum kahawae TaxID=34407 RepID=A0AAD9Y2V1_COLKA|nr:hypothetical protein CKAH01_02117 [Colletotrichum kahawae]
MSPSHDIFDIRPIKVVSFPDHVHEKENNRDLQNQRRLTEGEHERWMHSNKNGWDHLTITSASFYCFFFSTPVVDEQYHNNCLFDLAADSDTQLQPSNNRTLQEHHPRRANFRNTWLDRLRYAPLQIDSPGSFSLTAAVLVRRAASAFEPTILLFYTGSSLQRYIRNGRV